MGMWLLHLVAAFGCFCFAAGVNNGLLVPVSEHKYVVALTSSTILAKNYCTGGIIHERYILTAAHCFSGSKFIYKRFRIENPKYFKRLVRVYAGIDSLKRTSGAVKVAVEEVYFLKQYFVDGIDDIAVVKLDQDLTFGPNIGKLLLPASSDKSKVNGRGNVYAVVAGYGDDPENDKKNRANKRALKKAYLKFTDRTNCLKPYKRNSIEENQFCSLVYQIGDSSQSFHQYVGAKVPLGTCVGDSGAPIVLMDYFVNEYRQTNTIVGVVSGGIDCDGTDVPELHMSVANYVDNFIKPIIEERNWDESLIEKKDSKPDTCSNRFLG